MTEGQLQREIKSGWFRTLITTLVGIAALGTSTYTVVAKITAFELKVQQNEKTIAAHDARLRELENKRLPDGLAIGQLETTLRAVQKTLERVENRLERIEQQQRPR